MGTYSKAEAAQVPNQWWDVWDFFPNVSEREIENPFDHNWAKRPEEVKQNYDEEGNLKESLQLNMGGFPVPKYTREGVLYYTTRKDESGNNIPGHLSNETWREKLPYPFGKKRDNLSDYAFASWFFNQAPSQLAPVGALAKGIPQIRTQRRTSPHGFYKEGSVDVNQKNVEKIFSLSRFKNTRPKDLITQQGLYPKGDNPSLTAEQLGLTGVPGFTGEPYALEARPRINPSDARAIKRFNNIFNNKLQYPSLEEMNFALKSKSKRKKGDFYSRPDKTTEKQWAVIGKRLQETHGGTDIELKDFIERQKLAKAKIESEIDIENRLYQMNYLSMAQEMIDKDMLEGVENMEDLYGNPIAIQDVADFAYAQAVRMSQDPSKAQTMELGHVKAGRNIFDESKHLTTADYESNMRSEMKRSIRNWKHPKSKPLELIKGKDAKGRTTYEFTGGHLVEAGNRARGSDQDLPDIMNLLMGTMPNVETEYMRFLGELGYAVAPKQAIPTPEHFVAYMRNRWRKYQGWGKSKVLGKQQLERFPKVLRMYINDYLNDLDSGKFLNTKGRADATDDMILDNRAGKGEERTPWEEKVILDKLNDILGPDR